MVWHVVDDSCIKIYAKMEINNKYGYVVSFITPHTTC